jgi:hypothetical protein
LYLVHAEIGAEVALQPVRAELIAHAIGLPENVAPEPL